MLDQETIKIILTILQAVGAIGCAAIGFFYRDMKRQIEQDRENHTKLKDELAAFKLYVAQNYPTNSMLEKAVQDADKTMAEMKKSIDLLIIRSMDHKRN